jgi:SOS-response transcriptional repressor LexA
MKKPLSTVQRTLLEFIKAEIERTGDSPRVEDMGKTLGFTKTGAHGVLMTLERHGYLRRRPVRGHGVELEAAGKRALEEIDR